MADQDDRDRQSRAGDPARKQGQPQQQGGSARQPEDRARKSAKASKQ